MAESSSKERSRDSWQVYAKWKSERSVFEHDKQVEPIWTNIVERDN
jgi:hypothetical protein